MAEKEYIERDVVIAALKRQYGDDLGWQCTVNMSDVGNIIKDVSTADVVEVVHGEWKREQNRRTCSCCEFVYYDNGGLFNYCPNCGAKMDGKGDV